MFGLEKLLNDYQNNLDILNEKFYKNGCTIINIDIREEIHSKAPYLALIFNFNNNFKKGVNYKKLHKNFIDIFKNDCLLKINSWYFDEYLEDSFENGEIHIYYIYG